VFVCDGVRHEKSLCVEWLWVGGGGCTWVAPAQILALPRYPVVGNFRCVDQ